MIITSTAMEKWTVPYNRVWLSSSIPHPKHRHLQRYK